LPEFLDHIDGNTFNNCIENLRPATISQNNCNQVIRKDNTSGIKGVSWCKTWKKWKVRVQINRKRISFGYFKNLELAELVAIEARNKFHGNFAKHN
jgi:hypothetical protein